MWNYKLHDLVLGTCGDTARRVLRLFLESTELAPTFAKTCTTAKKHRGYNVVQDISKVLSKLTDVEQVLKASTTATQKHVPEHVLVRRYTR